MGNRAAAARVFVEQRRSAVQPRPSVERYLDQHSSSSRALQDQKILPRKRVVHISEAAALPHSLTTFTDFFKGKKSGLLFVLALLLVFISIVPLSVALKSYLWEKGRQLTGEGDVLYDQFMFDEFSQLSRMSGSERGVTDYTVPILKLRPYTVKKGDSLSSIAQRYKISLDTIISANHLSQAYFIQIGTVLQIPNMSGIFYSVKKGDSLSSITTRYNVDMNKLLDVNDLSSSMIYVGQRLFIPNGRLSDWERAEALGTLFKYPVKGRLTSRMGFRIDPFTAKRAYHAGIDLSNRIGTPVHASQSGKVTFVGYKGNYGKTVVIKHQQGYVTLYGHLDKVLVKRGQIVRQGERIGTLGNTGRSTGPHLHFEIHQYHKLIDPLKILSK